MNSAVTESFAELFENSQVNFAKLKPGAIVKGIVVDVRNDVVVINTGLKSEGIVPIEQFRNDAGEIDVGIGDEVKVALESIENGYGETMVSRDKAKKAMVWDELEEALEANATIVGRISGKVKGGFTVDIKDVRAFLPGSLVDVRPVRDPAYLEGKELEFKLIKLDRKRNNVVVSRRAVVETEHSEEREQLLEKLVEGAVLKGVVKNLTDYGAFVDLGGIDGLLHITDMAWKRVKHPSEVVKVGDEIDVRILKFDRERQRVSLGLKQLGSDPWQNIARRYPANTRLFGKVTNIADYGCFVEIEEGVEGLVHVSEMDWTNKNDHVTGKIKSITDFGIFIGLPGGIDGLVHLSDISWDAPGEEAVRKYKKGEDIEAVVLGIDPERERISLGIKQMDNDPLSTFMAQCPRGSIVKGTVTEVDARGATVDLGNGILGQLRASELSRDRVEDARSVLKVGDVVEAKFTGLDRKSRVISLSIKAREAHEEAEAVESYRSSDTTSGTTLGDLLKERMAGGNDD